MACHGRFHYPRDIEDDERRETEDGDLPDGSSCPMSFSEDDPPEMDFRWSHDDAWYAVELVRLDDVLLVRYKGFSSEHDEVFLASEFSSSREIERFSARFRASFVQMQDSECPTVKKGTEVCASFKSDTGDVKFYDAVVARVKRDKHGYNDEGEEVCCCSFWLSWKTGPSVGNESRKKIDDICLQPKDKRIDPTLVMFLKKANERLLDHASNVPESSRSVGSPQHQSSSGTGSLLPKTPLHNHQGTKKGDSPKPNSDVPHRTQLKTNNRDFDSMIRAPRKNKLARRTSVGRLNGICKKN